MYDAIIIGSGIGGLVSALMLAHQNHNILLIEKNNILGGRLSSFKKDGFTVDMASHIISRSEKGPLGEVFRKVGIDSGIVYQKVRPVSSYNGKKFVFPHDLISMVPKKEFQALIKFLNDIKEMSNSEIIGYDDIDVKTFLLRYTDNVIIHSCICNVTLVYFLLPIWEASAGEFIRCLKWESEAKASGYPQGGCGKIVDVFVNGIKKFGGEIIKNTHVNKIIVENNKIIGVEAGNNFYKTNLVISNAGIKQTILDLIDPKNFDREYLDFVRNLKHSWGGLEIRLGLDKKITDIKMLTQLGSLDQEDYYNKLMKGVIPKELNLFMIVPSNLSSHIAPDGKQLIIGGSAIPLEVSIDTQNKLMKTMLETIEKYIPNINKHIIWQQYMTTKKLDNLFGENGAIIGIAQKPGQVGDKRAKIKTPIKGLYIVGCETGGAGVGVELGVNSALEFIDKYALLI